MLTAEQVSDRCTDNDRPTVAEIAEHFEDTIFWNYHGSIDAHLDDPSRIECEYPLTVQESASDDEEVGYTERWLRFESGECTVQVATVYEGTSDETAREEDAHFIANLPVYIPAMFRELTRLREHNAELLAACKEVQRFIETLTVPQNVAEQKAIVDEWDLVHDRLRAVIAKGET